MKGQRVDAEALARLAVLAGKGHYPEFIEELFGIHFWKAQRQIVEAFFWEPETAVRSHHESGKCVGADELLTLADGSRRAAKELVGQDFRLPALTENGIVMSAATAEWNAYEPVFEILTDSGLRIVRNGQHPLWATTVRSRAMYHPQLTVPRWIAVRDVQPGMALALASPFSVFGDGMMPDDEVKLLAYIIGDGGCTVSSAVSFSQMDNAQLAEFRECATRLGCRLTLCTNPMTYMVRGRGQRGIRPYGTGQRMGVFNPLLELLRTHGVRGKHSRDKRVPVAVFGLRRELVAIFLSRLYATDGWACAYRSGKVPEIGFASASEHLVRDVQQLLLRFGIWSRIWAKPKTRSWSLTIRTGGDLLAFCDEIGIYGKEPAVAAVRVRAIQQVASRKAHKWRTRESLPGTRWEVVRSVRPLADQQTVAIGVPDTHTFLSPFYEHNSFSLAACCAAAPILAHVLGEECIVVTISSSWEQVEKTIWGEMHRFIGQSVVAGLPQPLQTEWRLGPRNFAIGLSPDSATNVQGFHAERVHVAVDEAAGIENPAIFTALDSLRSGINFDEQGRPSVTVTYTMNPTRANGPEQGLFDKPGVRGIVLDAFSSPNFWMEQKERFITPEELAKMPIERGGPIDRLVVNRNLITPRYAREVLDQHGTGPASPWWPRVRGEFPQQDLDSLIFREWVMAAADDRVRRARIAREAQGYPVIIGLDVAGPGEDETAFVARKGGLVVGAGAWREPDPQRAKHVLFNQLEPWLKEPGATVNIDSAGIGHYLALYLQSLGLQVNPINVGRRAFDAEKFANLKAELYWGLRERFAAGDIAGDIDKVTQAQLTSILYEENARRQILIEPKKKAKARGVKSPDRSEALMLAFATAPTRAAEREYRYAAGYSKEEEEAKPSRWMQRHKRQRRERIGVPV